VDDAVIFVTADGRYEDASPSALKLLGISLEELRASAPDRFQPKPPDPEESAAFRSEWERQGSPGLGGVATIKRGDGTLARVRFTITQTDDGRYRALMREVDEPVSRRPRVYTLGEVLAEWRAAERRLTSIPAGSSEYAAIQDDIKALRADYQRLFDEKLSRAKG
jgi:PAS domain-containing protein